MDHDDRLNQPPATGGQSRRDRWLVGLLLSLGFVAVLSFVLSLGERERPRVPPWLDCPPRPTAALPFDPADDRQLVAYATDVFVGRVVGGVAGPDPASPVPGAPPWVPPMHLLVEVLATEKGDATGTVVVNQALQFAIEGCHGAVAGDVPLEVGEVRRFAAVRDGPTGTYSLFAGPYSHAGARAPLGGATPRATPAVTTAP